ncbi:MAG: alginate export family protein, partial [Acidobacteriia bacterium]|nr:alginate export family protein [Terriglobia bacterium]
MKRSLNFLFAAALLTFGLSAPLAAQYDKVAALGSDTSITPIGGPASAPPIEIWPYDFPDFRPTGELNDQLPKWLQFGLEERLRWEGYSGGGFKPNNSDFYLLNRIRVGMILRPVSWFRIVSQVQDARPFFQKPPIGPPNENRWDLKLAYAEFGDPETQHISIRIGRQEIDYNNTIIASSEWRNQGRAYDGVVTNMHFDRFRLGLFAASIVNPLDEGISHHQEGNNIYGFYGGIDRVIPHSAIEPFVLWRVAPKVAVESATKIRTGKLDEKAYGFRVRGKEISNLDYRFELVGEEGSAGTNNISAWATTFGAGYRVTSLGGRPRLFAGYDYASGDKNPTDGTRNTFDTMYPTAHDRFGITDQFGWQNIEAARAGLTFEPHHRWSVTGQYLNFWLATATDAVYNTSGVALFRDPTGKSGTHMGDEFDFYTWYEINRQVHVGTG